MLDGFEVRLPRGVDLRDCYGPISIQGYEEGRGGGYLEPPSVCHTLVVEPCQVLIGITRAADAFAH